MYFSYSYFINKRAFLLTGLLFNFLAIQNSFARQFQTAPTDSSVIEATFFSNPLQKIECKLNVKSNLEGELQCTVMNSAEFFWKNEQWQKQPLNVEEILIPDSYTATTFEQIVNTGKWLSPFKNNINTPENLIIDPQKPTSNPNFEVEFKDTLFFDERAILLLLERKTALKFDTVFFEKKQTLKRTSTPRYQVKKAYPMDYRTATHPSVEQKNNIATVPNPAVEQKNNIATVPNPAVEQKNNIATVPNPAVEQKNNIATVPNPAVEQKSTTPLHSHILPASPPQATTPSYVEVKDTNTTKTVKLTPPPISATPIKTTTADTTTKTSATSFSTNASASGGTLLERKTITLEEAYQQTLAEVQKRRQTFAKTYKKSLATNNPDQINETLNQARTYLDDAIANEIVHYWYGTGFDKEGTAESPQQGRIACSYFVTTMLREAGFTLDRIRISQKGALDIAKYICQAENITHCLTVDEVVQLLEKKGYGLYIIAFNYHVGFLLYDSTGKYLIHASPLGTSTVSKVDLQTARSFEYSKFYDIGKLSDNKALIKKWLLNEKL